MDPMLVCLFVMERHPRVRQIIHQVVPVPRRHHRRQTDRRRSSFGSTRRYRPDSKRSSPVRDSRASPAVSSRYKRSPLLLPWASKGPILKRGHVCAPLTLSPRDNKGFSFWPVVGNAAHSSGKIAFLEPGEGNPPQVLLLSSVLLVVATLQPFPPPYLSPITKAQSKGLIGAKLAGMTKPGAERGKHPPNPILPCNFNTSTCLTLTPLKKNSFMNFILFRGNLVVRTLTFHHFFLIFKLTPSARVFIWLLYPYGCFRNTPAPKQGPHVSS